MLRTFILARTYFAAIAGTALILVTPSVASAQPKTREVMQVLEYQIQRSKPSEILKRTVLIKDVKVGEGSGGVYPLVVSLTVHDYSPGFPPNKYYGKTCLAKVEHAAYRMVRDQLREWTIEGRTTFPDAKCVDNPAANVSSFPLDSLSGTRVGSSAPMPAVMTKSLKTFVPRMGEYACVFPGGRMAANKGFRLKLDKTYTDVARAHGGTYVYEPFGMTLAFHGGFMDGQTGKFVEGTGLVLSPTLTCTPWTIGRMD
jgi:hypothetical protein